MKRGKLPIPGLDVPEHLVKYGVKGSDWQYAVKSASWRPLQRPGVDLRVRIFATCQLHAPGYPSGGGEFAMMQVGKIAEGDKPKFAPLTPSAISDKLLKVAIEEYRRSGTDMNSDADREKLRTSLPHVRRMIESMEADDGTVTRVTVTAFLSPDESTRKRAGSDVLRLMTEGLSFDQARALKLIVPIRELSNADRQRLAGKSFLYVHIKPRPATIAALKRHTLDDFSDSNGNPNGPAIEAGKEAQYLLKFGRAHGITDPKLAERLAQLPNVAADIERFAEAERMKSEAKESLDMHLSALAPLIGAYHATGELPAIPASAVQSALPGVLIPESAAMPAAQPATVQRSLPGLGAALVNGHAVQSSAAVNSNGKETPARPSATAADPETGCTPEEIEMPAEVYAVLGAMRRYSKGADADAASELIKRCRALSPACTTVAICEAIQLKGPMAKGKLNPVGMLLTAVPKMFTGGASPPLPDGAEEEESMRDRALRLRRTANG